MSITLPQKLVGKKCGATYRCNVRACTLMKDRR